MLYNFMCNKDLQKKVIIFIVNSNLALCKSH